VKIFLEAHRHVPKHIVLDATDTPLHGKQEGRYFDRYYGRPEIPTPQVK
jgi:hypothetical protein